MTAAAISSRHPVPLVSWASTMGGWGLGDGLMCNQLADRDYFRAYRSSLGFTSQATAKEFLSGKNVSAGIDYEYIDRLLTRLNEIITAVNSSMHISRQHENIAQFCSTNITDIYTVVRETGNLPRLNNQGRRPENVLYSWLRGYAMTRFLQPTIADLFAIDPEAIHDFGDDDFRAIETFRRTPKADLQLTYGDTQIVIEVQSGFQNINDIKQHKVLEAKRIRREEGVVTICMHFDVFNGQVAFVRLDAIDEENLNWITRQQMEGQTVFNIDLGYFGWRVMNPLPTLDSLDLNL
ncbi:MAG: hypothetical protein JKX70_04025 [Phycisphaerales bacterium]|nr:hypothetical protein [Phycisphaerales bacterium]